MYGCVAIFIFQLTASRSKAKIKKRGREIRGRHTEGSMKGNPTFRQNCVTRKAKQFIH
jgi:hypothetical protein